LPHTSATTTETRPSSCWNTSKKITAGAALGRLPRGDPQAARQRHDGRRLAVAGGKRARGRREGRRERGLREQVDGLRAISWISSR